MAVGVILTGGFFFVFYFLKRFGQKGEEKEGEKLFTVE